jgi:hypothetical protein
MKDKIEKIKELMTDVSTGEVRIQDVNEQYKELYNELDEIFEQNNMKNPNPYSDLWEFHYYWSKKLKSYADRRAYIIKMYKNIKLNKIKTKINTFNYIHEDRIKNLEFIKNKDFDLLKLIQLCRELNISYSSGCYLSVAMLVRSILDHVPPIFAKKTFKEVVNNYGSKSFKDSIKNLENSSRKIADSFLHTRIRKKESLPNSNQVDFSNDLDVLLAEIYRILK